MSSYPSYDLDDAMRAAVSADGQGRYSIYPCPLRAVVLGRGSKVEVELNLDAVRADDVPVLQRAGGGCAVWLDPDNMIISLALRLPGLGGSKQAFAEISPWLARGLARVGVDGVAMRGHSDLAVGEHKVGGACIHRSRDFLYYSATLLWRADRALMQRYLPHPPREPDYRQGRAHSDFVSDLHDLGIDTPQDTLVAQLDDALDRTLLGQSLLPWNCDIKSRRGQR